MRQDEMLRIEAVLPGASLGTLRLPADLAFVVARGEGATIWTTDGRQLVDYVLGSGPLVLGHGHPRIVEAVKEQVERGTTFYYLNEPATRLAERLVELVPCAEAVKFCGSGTEATFYALRIARAATGREAILKFAGGFHGSLDYGLQTLDGNRRVPESAGIPRSVADGVLVAPFNDLAATVQLAQANRETLAAVIVEPVQRSLVPLPGFLEGLRELCDRIGAVLIFDEVVTGFRMSLGGAQQVYGVIPDLCALGKAMGGGLPIAAVAGRRDLLELTVPTLSETPRSVYMGNTLNGNPLACAAGLAALEVLVEEDGPTKLASTGSALGAGLLEVAARLSVPFQVIGPPAFSDPIIGNGTVVDQASYLAQNRLASVAFAYELIRRGIFINPGKATQKMYVSTVHTQSQIDMTVEVAYDALKAVQEQGLIRD
jgi:glutamate-1-semialdehyde 2,1-aminomutase